MSIGCFSLVPFIAAEFERKPPKSVLDLGIGMGFYGAVVRQWVDRGVQPWRCQLDGVEVFADYSNPSWTLYDIVYQCDLKVLLQTNRRTYDVVLAMDVLEHFSYADAGEVVSLAKKSLNVGGVLFVGTPAVWMPQGAAYGNEYETHRSLIDAEWLTSRGFKLLLDGSVDHFGNRMLLGEWRNG